MNMSLESMWILIKIILTLWISSAHGQVKHCDFPKITHGALFDERIYKPYFPTPIGKSFYYYCYQDFVSHSNSYWGTIKCTQSGWEPMPTELCRRKCIFNYLENGNYPWHIGTYQQGQSVEAKCYSGYRLPNGESFMTCTENGWDPPPRCIRISISCGSPPVVENAEILNQLTSYPSGERVRYECKKPFVVYGDSEVQCLDGNWTDPPQCKDSTGKCGTPPPIANGDITSFPLTEYAPESEIEYKCQNLYKLEGDEIIRCHNGQWSQPPKCLSPCTISEDIMNKHKIQFRWRYKRKLYSESGDIVEFMCKRGHYLISSESFRATCIDGKITYPKCG